MYRKGDIINADAPKDFGEWSCLMFTEDAKPVHDSMIKYMGKVRPVCREYLEQKEAGRNLFCHACRHQCPNREYRVKYVTDIGLAADREEVERETNNLWRQADMDIVSPFLMQTVTSGETKYNDMPVSFVVLESIKGQELGEYIAAIHNLPDRMDTEWRCLDLIRQLLLAVRAYAKPRHCGYYVHRDLKPSNVMVNLEWENEMPFQQLKIIDFDMMVAQNNIQENTLYLGGSKGYVHPEAFKLINLPQDTKRQFSHQWDLYAVGLMIYEILEGHPYFADDAYLYDPEKAYVLDMGEESETALEYPELVEMMRRLMTNTSEAYTDIDQVIIDYQHFLEKTDSQWYRNYFLKSWLECGGDFDKGLTFCKIYCRVCSEGLKEVRQNFCVNANSVVPLIYGKNIIGADYLSGRQTHQKEIGVFSLIISPDGSCALKFVPLSEECCIKGSNHKREYDIYHGENDSHRGKNLEADDEIRFDDVRIIIERIA